MRKSIFTIFAANALVCSAKVQENVQSSTPSATNTDTRSNFILGAKLGANY